MAFQPQPKLFSLMGWNATGDLGGLTFYTNNRGKLVWFLKAPPTTPPTYGQLRNQDTFIYAALTWKALTPKRRADWELASKQAGLRITGYNLFIYFFTTADQATINTIEQQTGLKLTNS